MKNPIKLLQNRSPTWQRVIFKGVLNLSNTIITVTLIKKHYYKIHLFSKVIVTCRKLSYQLDGTDTYRSEDVKHVSPRLHLLSVLRRADWHVSSSAALGSFHVQDLQHPTQHLQKRLQERFFSGIPFLPAFCTLRTYLSCTSLTAALTWTSLKAEVDWLRTRLLSPSDVICWTWVVPAPARQLPAAPRQILKKSNCTDW